jgi:hypothetical protein
MKPPVRSKPLELRTGLGELTIFHTPSGRQQAIWSCRSAVLVTAFPPRRCSSGKWHEQQQCLQMQVTKRRSYGYKLYAAAHAFQTHLTISLKFRVSSRKRCGDRILIPRNAL